MASLRQQMGKSEKWIEGMIEQVRNNQLTIPENSAAYVIAWHRDLDGKLLNKHTAAVELINIIRPIVAIARYITFAALALYEHPECRQKIQNSEHNEYSEWFVQEVRRFYPFFPFTAAIVRQDFDWQGYHFPQGRRVLLDLYGTNHDPQIWENPEAFEPERFRHWDGSQFNFIPQGGGDYYTNHRCAGEWITIKVMKVTLNFLTQALEYNVPEQDLAISLSKMPTIPKSGFVISNVRQTNVVCR